jgi:hypothetical protein
MLHPRILADLARDHQAELIAESRRAALVRELKTARTAPRRPDGSSLGRAVVALGGLVVTIVLVVTLPGHGA